MTVLQNASPFDAQSLVDAIRGGDRRSLARAITLVESARADHRGQAQSLLAALGTGKQALRIGLSGTPGVGEIDLHRGVRTDADRAGDARGGAGCRSVFGAVGRFDSGRQDPDGIAVARSPRLHPPLAQPDATRWRGAAHPRGGGFVRSGWVRCRVDRDGRRGQSETVVAELCDIFLLLLAPAGGDELQGVKRGIMEMADLIVVNKADGDLKQAAMRTCADYSGALHLLRRRPQDPPGYPRAMTASALDRSGMDHVWAEVQHLAGWRRGHGHWANRRAEQARHWFAEEVRQGLLAALTVDPARAMMAELGDAVAAGAITPEAAAARLLRQLSA